MVLHLHGGGPAGRTGRGASAAGGRVTYRAWAGTGHCWHIAVPSSGAAREALAEVVAFPRAYLAR
ncbi:hypothetical protein ALLO2DRAFT_03998 [Frankia sp. Allo2]|nr:hypothetical protein ALLO2DRAFT_03998 [Frankia sp. Allo2]OAA21163.1 hypothetical protein AAY23_10817 [Frankia casuarinae]